MDPLPKLPIHSPNRPFHHHCLPYHLMFVVKLREWFFLKIPVSRSSARTARAWQENNNKEKLAEEQDFFRIFLLLKNELSFKIFIGIEMNKSE